ncbi:DUF4157 domain-containing protein [Adhaeribacter rhizoryzae]|uniref:DUF4157 domain-containing protein n=2 Tax=Adhaeribacter rhizoryzae TaxID=2607907 RepID=A0A5M6DLQ3_9BACT|nr:DUF4157 domain-containing protein [Adhaeribacter rhizoryzae]
MADKIMRQASASPAEKQEQGKLQTKPLANSITPIIRRQSEDATAASAVNSTLENQIISTKGGGDALPGKTREEMEAGFGTDFGNVRTHTNADAVQMNKDLSAQAFTHGNDIYFNAGKYAPETHEGKRLLAHELTHTVQQGGSVKPKLVQKAGEENEQTTTFTNKKKDGTVERVSPAVYKLIFKNFSVPKQKQTFFKPVTFKFPATRADNQIQVWSDNILKDDAVDKKIEAKLKAKNAPPLVKNQPGEPAYGLRLKNRTGDQASYIIGTIANIKQRIIRPYWLESGKTELFDVDHQHEMQLGGPPDYENLWLWQASANRSSGSKLDKYLHDRIDDLVQEATGPEDDKIWKKKTSRKTFTIEISSYKPTMTVAGDATKFYTRDDIRNDLKPLDGLVPLTDKEIQAIGFGRTDQLLLFPNPVGGRAYTFKPWNPDQPSWKGNIKLGENAVLRSITYQNGQEGTIGITLFENHKMIKSATDPFPLKPMAGIPMAASIPQGGPLLKSLGATSISLFSPVEFLDAAFEEGKGLVARGRINVPDLPFLKRKDGSPVTIDLLVSGNDVFIQKTFSTEEITLPKPFNITNSSLTISLATRDIGKSNIAGELNFEIENVGAGHINGKIGADKKFAINGEFIFDKKLLDGTVKVGYEAGNWFVSGAAKLGKTKIPGVKTLAVAFSYDQVTGIFTGSGEAKLSTPIIDKVGITVSANTKGDFTIVGTADFSKIPRLNEASGEVTIDKTDEGWDLAIVGKAKPDIDIKGLKLEQVNFTYKKGLFTLDAGISYENGKIHGNINAGVTNKPVKEDGTKGEGEPGKELHFYADGTLRVEVAAGIDGTIKVKIKPDGDITIAGKLELTEDKYIVDPKSNPKALAIIPEFKKEIPVLSCGIASVKLGLVGGVYVFYDFDGIKFDKSTNIQVHEVSLNNLANLSLTTDISMSTGLRAGVKAYIGATAALVVLIAGIRGTGKINLTITAIDAKANAKAKAAFSPEKGLQLTEASVSFDVYSKIGFDVSLGLEVYLDLILGEISLWSHEWKPEALKGERKFKLFDEDIKLPLNFGENNKIATSDLEQDFKAPLEKKANNEETYVKASNNAVNEDGAPSKEEKDEEARQNIKRDIKQIYRGPYSKIVFAFNSSIDSAYFDQRFGILNQVQNLEGLDPKAKEQFVKEIEAYEFEEYEAFGKYLETETYFDAPTLYGLIDEFIYYRPTLGETERINLRSLVPANKAGAAGSATKKGGKKKTPVKRMPLPNSGAGISRPELNIGTALQRFSSELD